MRGPRVYEKFRMKNGEPAIIRNVESNDLHGLVTFFNDLVGEKQTDSNTDLHVGFDKRLNLEEESEWLNETLSAVHKGDMTCIIAEVEGKIIANGGITRGKYAETRHYGSLGLTVSRTYRGRGVGRKMIERLLSESSKMGIKTVEVEFLSTNQAAKVAYERAGFHKTGSIPGKVFRNGKYLDAMIMTRESPESS